MASPQVDDQERPEPSSRTRMIALVLRECFLALLLGLTLWVGRPQVESFWAAYETVGDFLRLLLCAAASIWIFWHLFTLPKEAGAYRAWLYVGSFGIPLIILTAYSLR